MYSLADNDCDAGKWWPALPPPLLLERPRFGWLTDASEASVLDVSWPFDVDDEIEEGVSDAVK